MYKHLLTLKELNLEQSRAIVLTDVDGVLTDGTVYLMESQTQVQLMRQYHLSDGHAVELLRNSQVAVIFLSGEHGPSILNRANKLKVPFFNIRVKYEFIMDIKSLYPDKPVGAMGNDTLDVGMLTVADFCAVPRDHFLTAKELIAAEPIITTRKGGQGAFREFAEMFLQYLTMLKKI